MLSNSEISSVGFEVTEHFRGDLSQLESAIGTMFVAKQFGWKVVYLAHEKRTLKKYEDILGVSFREDFPEVGPQAERSLAFRAVQHVQNYWKAVKGEIKGIRTSQVE